MKVNPSHTAMTATVQSAHAHPTRPWSRPTPGWLIVALLLLADRSTGRNAVPPEPTPDNLARPTLAKRRAKRKAN
jgi:hypothetical protein